MLAALDDDLDRAVQVPDEDYRGQFASLADCLEEACEDLAAVPERLRRYIDWDAMARDTMLNGEVFTVETGPDEVHVFWSR